jgi:hypothetical protein
MERCPDAFAAWTDRKSNTDLARRTKLRAFEVEAKDKLVFQNISKIQNIILHILMNEAVKIFP